MNYVEEVIIEMKRRVKDPYIVLAGDFNQWRPEEAVQEFTDIREVLGGPTRGSRRIDRVFTNFEQLLDSGTLNPLQTDGEDGHIRHSDHLIVHVTARLRRKEKYKWLSYSYRYYNKESAEKFGEWLLAKDWAALVQTPTSDKKAELYQAEITWAIENFFPLKTIKRRNIDPPWINGTIKKLIKARKRIYKETGGRTPEWKRMKKRIANLIDKRCKIYQESQKMALLGEDGARNFFKQTKNYMSKQRPVPFDVMNLFPGRSEQDVAELLAVHFNSISNEFEPLERGDVPVTFDNTLPVLLVPDVATRLRRFKKPKSMVRGDLFPCLVTKYADLLAVPLTDIYNEITRSKTWPKIWKKESVTIIPKTKTPTEVGQLRNISCTMLASKVYESYVLRWALAEVKLKQNQYGGSKGCGASHLLIDVWQNILSDLEDSRAVTLLTAIDYAKAFNRMQFQECLRSFARHGASTDIINLLATFLTDRHMAVRVGSCWSQERPVYGGVPQGSILGVLLFNMTTDNLEDEEGATGFNSQASPVTEVGSASEDEQEPNGSPPSYSTPAGGCPDFDPGVTPFRRGGNNFVFLDNVRNVRRALGTHNITVLRDKTLPEEPNPVTSAVWKHRPTDMHKYIDDGILDTKLNMETVQARGDPPTKDKHAVDTQNVFRRTIRNAESIGMKANTDKTNLLCISDAMSYKAVAHFFSMEGRKLTSAKELKILGFRFSQKPTCEAQVNAIKRSFRGRYWLIIHMKQHHYTEEELVRAYQSIIRPIAEYCSVVFHAMLTDKQDEDIERLQSTALRYIYGYGISYARMREMAGLDTLRSRRIRACDKFANTCAQSERFAGWFPLSKPGRRSRHTLTYREDYARCDRLRNSPVFYMRRRLNGKEGKSYGQRYRHYRDA